MLSSLVPFWNNCLLISLVSWFKYVIPIRRIRKQKCGKGKFDIKFPILYWVQNPKFLWTTIAYLNKNLMQGTPKEWWQFLTLKNVNY